MKLAFAVFIVSLTAVSSQFVANWTLDWQSHWSNCAPDYFLITGASTTGYSISYTYPGNLNCPTSFNSTLTPIGSSGTIFNDTIGQNITYYPNNNTILLVVSSNYPKPVVFSQNGAYISQEEVAGLVAGAWSNLAYNSSSCLYAPPLNVSIQVSQSLGGIYSPKATYYMTNILLNKSISTYLTLFVPQIDQPMWMLNYPLSVSTANISYIVDPVTNQSTLQFHVPQYSMFGVCIGNYTRPSILVSGTWYPNLQDGNVSYYVDNNDIPTSIQVITIFNMYMRVKFNYNTIASITAVLYSSTNGYVDSYYGYNYDPVASTFTVNFEGLQFLYSQNGSVLSVQSFLGKWSNPVLDILE